MLESSGFGTQECSCSPSRSPLMAVNLVTSSLFLADTSHTEANLLEDGAEAKRPLDALHVKFVPIPLHDLVFANGHAAPLDPHQGDLVLIVLIENDVQLAVVTLGPRAQAPILHDLSWWVKLGE